MSTNDFNFIDSILTITPASGSLDDATKDLNLPEGKSIAELLDDQEKKFEENN